MATAFLSLSACPTPATFHTAKPIEAGKMDIGLAAHTMGVAAGGGHIAAPNIEFQFRYGVADWFDFGIKVYPVGLMVDFNFCVLNLESFALSIDPAFSGSGIFLGEAGGFLGYFYLPVLMDVVNTSVVTLTVGPKPMLAVGTVESYGASASSAVFYIGGMVGVKLQFTKLFSLMPEGNVFWSPELGTFIWDGGVSFNFTF